MDKYKKIGNKIKFYREKNLLSLSAVSEKTGISKTKLLNIEEGNITYSFKTLEKISVCLNVSLQQLLDIE